MPESPAMYEIWNLQHEYNRQRVLDIEHLRLEPGSSIGLIGPNGCGKSTLLRILAFLEAPTRGEFLYYGRRIRGDEATGRSEVTLLLQEPYLLKRSVFENVAYGLRVRGRRRDLAPRVHQALEAVGLPPEKFGRRRWFELSGGEAQRVSLATRLAFEPRVLLLDEPTASVDQTSALLMQEAIARMRQRYGTSLIIASHDVLWLNRVTDEVLRVHKGRIVGSSSENLIPGPWEPAGDHLAARTLPDGQRILAVDPPEDHAMALLDPADILLSLERPAEISARNILKGTIENLSQSKEPGKIRVTVHTGGLSLTSLVTHPAARSLNLFPGSEILIVFKASSLRWT